MPSSETSHVAPAGPSDRAVGAASEGGADGAAGCAGQTVSGTTQTAGDAAGNETGVEAGGDTGGGTGGAIGGGIGIAALPIALAALSVDGRCRERSPADEAIFGTEAARFAERFADPALGQAMLARAATDGTAEGRAALLTPAGPRAFRISLWRQRGGERIRILAAFAADTTTADAAEPLPRLANAGRALAHVVREIQAPIAAVIALSSRLRGRLSGRAGGADAADDEPAALTEDLLAAGWRLSRVAADADAMARAGTDRPMAAVAEVDAGQILRRILRLIAPVAANAGVEIRAEGLPGRGEGPIVLCDEGALWSVMEALVIERLEASADGGAVSVRVERPARGGLVVAVAGEDGGPPTPERLRPAVDAAAATGARIGTGATPSELTLSIPPERVIDPA